MTTVEMVARAMAQASGRDPDGVTAPPRGQMGSRKLWELYVPQAEASLGASHHAELVEALTEVRRWVQAAHDDRDTGTQPMFACFNALQEIDAALAKIGGSQ